MQTPLLDEHLSIKSPIAKCTSSELVMSSFFSLSPSTSISKSKQHQQTAKKPASIRSSCSSKSLSQTGRLASAWSSFSLDHLPFYSSTKSNAGIERRSSRRLSDTGSMSHISINSNSNQAASATVEEDETAVTNRGFKQKAKIDEFMHGFFSLFLMCMDDCSQGFYKIFDHVRRRVPAIVQQKIAVRNTSDKVNIAIADIRDVKENVMDLERQIDPFRNMYDMIQASVILATATAAIKRPVNG